MAFIETTAVGAVLLSKMLANGCMNIKKNIETINNLNVFPVPDGDTGTNMYLTVHGGISAPADESVGAGDFLRDFCMGVLFSARGNSGIIFSQYLKGFADYSAGKDVLDADTFRDALSEGVKRAYGSVLVPTEGTMLTVIREAAEAAKNICFRSFEEFFSLYIAKMESSLEHTPDLLPCLREAGVVDSGGAGIVTFFRGMLLALEGEIIEGPADTASEKNFIFSASDDLLKYGYCTDFLIRLNKKTLEEDSFSLGSATDYLRTMGDSVVAFRENNCVKIHVHTKKPGDVLNYAQQFGEFLSVKIENMSVQSDNATTGPVQEKKKLAVVAVASGEGIIDYFRDSGADVIISGGQTNNPSVESFIDAYESVNAEKIICLPNNGNTILAAQQSAKAYKDAEVTVLPSKTVTEGLAALSIMNPADTFENTVSDMEFAMSNVTTGFVAKSTRTCTSDGLEISEGDFIGISADRILSAGKDLNETAMSLIRELNKDGEKQVVTVFYGKNVTENEASALEESVTCEYPFIETGTVSGKQDVYEYIISLE